MTRSRKRSALLALFVATVLGCSSACRGSSALQPSVRNTGALRASGSSVDGTVVGSDPAGPRDTGNSQSAGGYPAVGPLFPASEQTHFCTAAVVDSVAHDLLLTAAHCLSGSAAGMHFTPGYVEDTTPGGTWSVTEAYADKRWIQNEDPHFDYAFLRVAPDAAGDLLEDVVPGFELRAAAVGPELVSAVGYGAGSDDLPIVCGGDTRPFGTGGAVEYLEFDCAGFVGGTSGSPLLAAGDNPSTQAIVGLIGGLHGGGCSDFVSYSPALNRDALTLLQRASGRGSSDVMPVPLPPDC